MSNCNLIHISNKVIEIAIVRVKKGYGKRVRRKKVSRNEVHDHFHYIALALEGKVCKMKEQESRETEEV